MKTQQNAITVQEGRDRAMALPFPEDSLEGAEARISQCLKEAARNVIAVGYYLKRIRDKRLFEAAGYQNIWEYARERYGFSMSTASRYMSRNDKFSEGGNSPVLDERYRGYGKAQLQEMLSLDEEQLERVTPDMTVQQIREVRREKDFPYVEIPGQMNIADFPDVLPEEGEEEEKEPAPLPVSYPGRTTLCISDICSGCEEGAGGIIATPQSESGEMGHDRKEDGAEGCGSGPDAEPGQQALSVLQFTICRNADLYVRVSDKMKEDFVECARKMGGPDRTQKDCGACSWQGMDVGRTALCDIVAERGVLR